MYATPSCYDGNVVKYENAKESRSINIQDIPKTGNYVFSLPHTATDIQLIKEAGSLGKVNTPGSPDSPSVRIRVLESSIPLAQLGVQGYLTNTIDKNDDSLSIWLEWTKCPSVIEKGTEISIKIEISAYP